MDQPKRISIETIFVISAIFTVLCLGYFGTQGILSWLIVAIASVVEVIVVALLFVFFKRLKKGSEK